MTSSGRSFVRASGATLAVILLVGPSLARASDVSPSVEITGGDGTDICDNSSGTLSPQIPTIFNRYIDSSTLSQLHVLGAGIVDSSLETEPFGGPPWSGTFGFLPSAYDVPPGTFVAARMTTYYGPAGAGGVSFIGEVVFDCDDGTIVWQ